MKKYVQFAPNIFHKHALAWPCMNSRFNRRQNSSMIQNAEWNLECIVFCAMFSDLIHNLQGIWSQAWAGYVPSRFSQVGATTWSKTIRAKMCPMRLECKKMVWFGVWWRTNFYLEASHNLKTSHSHMDQTWILWFCSFIHNPFYRLGNRYFSSESGLLDHLRNLDKKI